LTTAEFYLDIARNALDQLKRVVGPVMIGSEYSEHFRHAAVTTAFAAFAVERAMTELIWIECFLITPPSERWKGVLLASKLRSIPDKLDFLAHKGILQDHRKKIQILFERRNQLAHLRNSDVVTYSGGTLTFEDAQEINRQGRSSELDAAIMEQLRGQDDAFQALANEFGSPSTSLSMPGISSETVYEAEENLAIAEAAHKILMEIRTSYEVSSPDDSATEIE